MHTEEFVPLPELGEGVTEGELVKWMVSEGDSIKTDQPVAEVMTDKAVMEIPSPVEGTVESFFAKEGDTIPVGHKLLKLKSTSSGAKSHKEMQKGSATGMVEKGMQKGSATGDVIMTESQKGRASHKDKDSAQSHGAPLVKEGDTNAGDAPLVKEGDTNAEDKGKGPSLNGIKASPFTRREAKELNIDLHQVTGSSVDGRIKHKDVLRYSQEHESHPPRQSLPQGGEHSSSVLHSDILTKTQMDSPLGFAVPKEEGQDRQALKGIRKKIAQKMQASKAVIPHFTLLESAEVEQLEKLKSSVKESLKEKNIKVTYLSFVMKALLETLKDFPTLNASIDDFSQEIVYKNYYHFGFAVDTPRGLLVPVIKNVDKKSLAELSYEIQHLAEKARQGTLQTEDMKGGTITITNIGSLGGEYATPIINAPESAILGMYRIFVKACWDGGQFVPKKTMNFSLTCDHRLIDGAVSARALKCFIHKIENPLSLFI